MPQLLLELFSEEIPARMQAQAAKDLERMAREHLAAAGCAAGVGERAAGQRHRVAGGDDAPARLPGAAAGRLGGAGQARIAAAIERLAAAPPADEVTFSANDLEQARSNNRAADGEINTIWSRMDPAIQQRLLGEQRGWIQSKNNSCRQAAAQAGTTLQAEYLQLQCDTRMTRERSQYLRGYTIN